MAGTARIYMLEKITKKVNTIDELDKERIDWLAIIY